MSHPLNRFALEFKDLKTCELCGVPEKTPVHISKSEDRWTDEHDLATKFPDDWTKATVTYKIRRDGLCDRCHAKVKEAA